MNQMHLFSFMIDFIFHTNKYPEEKSKIVNHETLNKRTIEKILNEIFTNDVSEN